MASTIKVDNVQNQPGTNIVSKCGTDVTLGASGDTVALAAGASQTGFGRTGTVDWITTPKVTGDSPITGVTGKGYFLNTTAGVITLNLPAGAAGSIVSMADYAGTWQTYNVTISPNGTDKIGGLNSNTTLNTEGQSVTFVFVDSTQGWINTMDSTSNVRGETFVAATVSGACNTLATSPDCANTKIATFVGPGTFCVSTVNATPTNNVVSYMVVAGGGGGGARAAAGAGAGGFREYKSPVTPYTASPLDGNPCGTAITVTASPYPIVVGGGGAGGTPGSQETPGSKGATSTFSTIDSAGGGSGKGGCVCTPRAPLANGGSGGGGGPGSDVPMNVAGTGNTPPTTPSQGNNGGANPSGALFNGAGGGGAGAVGQNAAPASPAAGGVGVSTSISASPVFYAGGGGGGSWPGPNPAVGGAGGNGGGGNGRPGGPSPTDNPPRAGSPNTGGGGAGEGGGPPGLDGGAGGSGIVIIRYKFQ